MTWSATAHEWRRGPYTISTDPALLDVAAVHAYLTRSYWAAGIPIEIVRRSLEHSVNFGIFRDRELVGFGRVITDRATFGYLGDVFVLEPHRGRKNRADAHPAVRMTGG